MGKMWEGRFSKALDKTADDFNSSISFDSKMFRQDIKGSMAHAAMLGAQGIITQEDAEIIIGALQGILEELEKGTLEIDMACEDIHMFVEAELTKRIGDVGKRLHTARSRNDQVALDLRMYLRDETKVIVEMLKNTVKAITEQAMKNKDANMRSIYSVLINKHLQATINARTTGNEVGDEEMIKIIQRNY